MHWYRCCPLLKQLKFREATRPLSVLCMWAPPPQSPVPFTSQKSDQPHSHGSLFQAPSRPAPLSCLRATHTRCAPNHSFRRPSIGNSL